MSALTSIFAHAGRASLLLAASFLIPAGAQAATIVAAYGAGLIASITVGSDTGEVGPISIAQGSAPPAFLDTENESGFYRETYLGRGFNSDLTARYSITSAQTIVQSGQASSPVASATSDVASLFANVIADPRVSRIRLVFGLSAADISSTTSYDGARLVGASSYSGLIVQDQYVDTIVDGAAFQGAAPNTVAFDMDGLKVVLNEQIAVDTGGLRSLTTNAVHLSLTNFAYDLRTLNGDIILGQSRVSVAQALPEPTNWALMILGFAMIGGALRHKRSRVRA
jgi:hypothetical protein